MRDGSKNVMQLEKSSFMEWIESLILKRKKGKNESLLSPVAKEDVKKKRLNIQ